MKLKDAFAKITKTLRKDKGYRQSWKANIAMCYIDNEREYKQRIGKKTLNKEDKHIIANLAAAQFIMMLCSKK